MLKISYNLFLNVSGKYLTFLATLFGIFLYYRILLMFLFFIIFLYHTILLLYTYIRTHCPSILHLEYPHKGVIKFQEASSRNCISIIMKEQQTPALNFEWKREKRVKPSVCKMTESDLQRLNRHEMSRSFGQGRSCESRTFRFADDLWPRLGSLPRRLVDPPIRDNKTFK